MNLSLAFSPCPNDTFLFGAIALGLVSLPGVRWGIHHLDIETLNEHALEGRFDVTKLSVHAWLSARRQYRLLNVGSAFTDHEGPVLVANRACSPDQLKDRRLVFPGRHTTAYLLYRIMVPETGGDHHFLPYDQIVPAVASGRFDAGVIIHETRFTFAGQGLHLVADLGHWWRELTGLPLPLGCCVMRSSLYPDWGTQVETLMTQSLAKADEHGAGLDDYIRAHARELSPDVLQRHIQLFVNHYTRGPGSRGWNAMQELEHRAQQVGIVS
ncbi:MAG: 1,4-dihydroxy-6-naphthoate synthase [Magnetococcales bacterium]|nr:1,4-dihydroxy-6-naphthoate synthase [Magnetococcales bacterium]